MYNTLPVLYSFRRCPYAMRARMALLVSGLAVELREVVFRNKPASLLQASPKATVPVLVLPDQKVIDESFDIMLWALQQNDPENWLAKTRLDRDTTQKLVDLIDGPFKYHLDRYKYANRYENTDAIEHRSKALKILSRLEDSMTNKTALIGQNPALADYAIFPFIRQFANTDRCWFDEQDLPCLQEWLSARLESKLFAAIMQKYKPWKPGDKILEFPKLSSPVI